MRRSRRDAMSRFDDTVKHHRLLDDVPGREYGGDVEDQKFGSVVRAAREAAGITLSDAARSAKVSKQYLSLLELGGMGPSFKMARRVAEAVGLEIVVRKAKAGA